MKYRVEPQGFEIDFMWRNENGVYSADWGYGNAISRINASVARVGNSWAAFYGHGEQAYYNTLR